MVPSDQQVRVYDESVSATVFAEMPFKSLCAMTSTTFGCNIQWIVSQILLMDFKLSVYPPSDDYIRPIVFEPTSQAPYVHIISSFVFPALRPKEVASIRRGAKNYWGHKRLHQAMRGYLNEISASTCEMPQQRVVDLPEKVPWKEYIAFHKEWKKLVGTGGCSMYLRFMKAPDHNRRQQLRLNYVVQQRDGSHVLLHPGRKVRDDAKLIYLNPGDLE